MTARRVCLGVVVALLAVGVFAAVAIAAAPAPKADPCSDGAGKKTKGCKVTAGPWVAVPATGEANFLLECPKRKGYVVGIDTLASSEDVRVVWEANPGSPVRPATSTAFFAFFRASSAHGKPGLFQPYLGCIPQTPNKKVSTVSWRVTKPERVLASARITRPGLFLDRVQTLFPLKSGSSRTVSQICGKGEHVLSGWHAVVFGSEKPPDPALMSKVHVTLEVAGGKVVASVQTDAGVPAAAKLQLQVGAVCAK
jgi:hypothetical protein